MVQCSSNELLCFLWGGGPFVAPYSPLFPPSPASLPFTNMFLPPSIHPPSSPTFLISSADLWASFLFPSFLLSFPLSVYLPSVVSLAGVLLFLTATALTSMTFFSCLVRHQTPALREATLLHRNRAAAKLCIGTARKWSWTAKERREGEAADKIETTTEKERGELIYWEIIWMAYE